MNRLLFLLLIQLCVSCNEPKVFLPKPYDKIHIGMNLEKVKVELDELNLTRAEREKIHLTYYKDCLRFKVVLAGCVVRDTNLYKNAKLKSVQPDIVLKEMLYHSSNLFESTDSALFVYDKRKVDYLDGFFILKSKRYEYEGCLNWLD